jgi:hypothetical protein
MLLNQEKIRLLLGALELTKEVEVDCDECFDSMAEFAESCISGETVPQALILIHNHIQICPDCAEEFNILKTAVEELATEGGKPRGH